VLDAGVVDQDVQPPKRSAASRTINSICPGSRMSAGE
jgi:hypothetical protein